MPYFFPTDALLAGMPPTPAGRDARAGRAVLLRHDDAGRPRHLGGGPRRRRRRAHRGRPRGRGGAGGVRPLPAARPPRHAARVRRLLLPQQRGGRRRGAAGRRARAGRGHRHRRAPRQRHAGGVLGAPGRPLRLAARRPGRRLVPARLRPRRRDRRRAPARVRRATCRCPRAPATGRGWTPSPGSPSGRATATALVVSLGVDAAGDDPESPLQVTADGFHAAGRAARRPGRCRACWSRRAATTWRTWVGWSRRTSRVTPGKPLQVASQSGSSARGERLPQTRTSPREHHRDSHPLPPRTRRRRPPVADDLRLARDGRRGLRRWPAPSAAPSTTTTTFPLREAQSGIDQLRAHVPDGGGATAQVVVHDTVGAVLQAADLRPSASGCRAIDHVSYVSEPRISGDGDTALVTVAVRRPDHRLRPGRRERLRPARRRHRAAPRRRPPGRAGR